MSDRARPALTRLPADAAGVTIVEFALVAPVFLLMLMGMLDFGQMIYGKTILSGAVEAAARSSSLEGGDTAAADALVVDRVKHVLPGVQIVSTRTSYYDFADIGRSEQWNDANGNGSCDNGEAFTDENSDGDWDREIGVTGNGAANDVVMYSVRATYAPVFKIPFMPAMWNTRTLNSTAIRKNQPYATQQAYSSTAGTCA
ncbi:MAG: TadE/TadG family type IV pilus assembly protein [Cypionkella sp.]